MPTGWLGELLPHIDLQVLDQRPAQRLSHLQTLFGAPAIILGRSISNSASIRRTTSTAMGESGTSFLPLALRRAFSSISSMAKNGAFQVTSEAHVLSADRLHGYRVHSTR